MLYIKFERRNEMIISVDIFFESQGKGSFYTVDDDIITGRATEGELEEEDEE
jgi:hypothetical protein